MYEQYWNVEYNPFEGGFDPRFFVRTQTHEAALLKLRYLVEDRKGAGLLVGGTGSGKTMIAKQLVHELPGEFGPVVHLVFPRLSPVELLAWLAVELGADEAAVGGTEAGLDRTLRQIVRQLTVLTQKQRHAVIIIDEAHLIEDVDVFQSLRLLLNLQDRERIDFSLILIGERSLLRQIGRIPQLDERLAVKSMLRPLTLEETGEYVATRLRAAGCTQTMFNASAVQALFELSGGVPRRINRICDLALLVGYADRLSEFSSGDIEAVAQELTAVVPD